MSRNTFRILHLTDSLDAGGAEKVAVQLANLSQRLGHKVWLGTTRRDGPLAHQVDPGVGRVRLERKWRFDLRPVFRLARWCRKQDIDLIHCHGSTVYVGATAKRLGAGSKLVWHDHHGGSLEHRRLPGHRFLGASVDGIIAVSEVLRGWLARQLGLALEDIDYIPNFSTLPNTGADPKLPGAREFRVVMVANFRRQKDHFTAVEAFRRVTAVLPKAHMFLVGSTVDQIYEQEIRNLVAKLKLEESIVFLGPQDDVGSILRRCQVGILSSVSEGLPLALLEYGLAGLATAATDVGQCSQVLGQGSRGLVVPPKKPRLLAEAITALLSEPNTAQQLGRELTKYVHNTHSSESTLARITELYYRVLPQP